ncbi:hypothetical protein F5884DRAFT_807579 [Xylogone sp. PMI_703]|nr:hypothetical protein F5884DRAFT_807579 [Xylogone sp. PMI_703]
MKIYCVFWSFLCQMYAERTSLGKHDKVGKGKDNSTQVYLVSALDVFFTSVFDSLERVISPNRKLNMNPKYRQKGTTPHQKRSTSSTTSPPITLEDLCTHNTVTRFYAKNIACEICHQVPALGWLWRCTQDRDSILLADVVDQSIGNRNNNVSDLQASTVSNGHTKTTHTPIFNLPDLDADGDLEKHPLEEQTDTTLYSDAPVTGIPSQQQNGKATITNEHSCLDKAFVSPLPEKSTVEDTTPKLSIFDTECQFKCCHTCRQSLLSRSFLSLDAIAKGDIPQTVITGFGFHDDGPRASKAGIVRNIGSRTRKHAAQDTKTVSKYNDNKGEGETVIRTSARPSRLPVPVKSGSMVWPASFSFKEKTELPKVPRALGFNTNMTKTEGEIIETEIPDATT